MKDSTPIYVLDSFAPLAFLEGEAGVEVVQEILNKRQSQFVK